MASTLGSCCTFAARLISRQTRLCAPVVTCTRGTVWDTAKTYTPPILDREELTSDLPADHPAKVRQVIATQSRDVITALRNPVIDKFTAILTRRGERDVAERVVMETLDAIKRIQYKKYQRESDPTRRASIERDPRAIMTQAIVNCKPLIQLMSVKRGGITYQVPAPLTEKKALFLGMRAMVRICRDTKGRATRMWDELAKEMLLAYEHEGKVVKKKEELHRQAEANRAYAHYRFIRRKK